MARTKHVGAARGSNAAITFLTPTQARDEPRNALLREQCAMALRQFAIPGDVDRFLALRFAGIGAANLHPHPAVRRQSPVPDTGLMDPNPAEMAAQSRGRTPQ